ncbi:MAG: protein kinase [Polyangiales bacterium]
MPLDSHETRAQVLGGRWELLAPLARGGMGVLYVGRHLQTGRRAAIKVVERAGSEALARFRLEASASAQIGHPGVVDVFDADFDTETGSCFIAMELLEGKTLREVLDDPTVTPERVTSLLMAALAPLAAAHAKGFVHRDLKPENLFVLASPLGGHPVKLLDFGIVSGPGDKRLTRDGMAMGTPQYMSPEQATSAREAGPTSDVWSMGVMLYEAIHGEAPFVGETGHGVIIQACTCPHMPLDQIVPGVDPRIARLIDRCLAKSPVDRPADASILRSELGALLHPHSLPAVRASLRVRPPSDRGPANDQHHEPRSSEVRPSIRTRSVANAANLLAASGVVCSLSALALPFVGLAAPGTALLCAAVGGGLLLGASARIKSLRELVPAPPKTPTLLTQATVVLSQRPKPLLHPQRGTSDAPVRIELYADLSCAISRRVCQRVLELRAAHPDEISIVWKPYWDPQRDMGEPTAEFARALFEREGPQVFWEFFDRMLAHTRRINTDVLYDHVSRVCPDMHGFVRAQRTHVHRRSLQLCREEAEGQGVSESPTLIINGTLIAGEPSVHRLHWAFVDAKCSRKVELSDTQTGEVLLARERVVRAFLIRYRGARNAPASIRRTREQARERALKLISRAQMEGNDFTDVALRFADSLIDAEKFSPDVIDQAMADEIVKLKVGDMSNPLECDEGYQVLQRMA